MASKKGKDKPKGKPGKVATAPAANSPLHVGSLLRVGSGFRLADVDAGAVVAGPESREAAGTEALALEGETSDLHERLWAASKGGGSQALLIVIQGMDTSGKGGAAKVFDRLLDPNGFGVVSFGVPTEEERAHHYLWRHEREVPAAGRVKVHDRSHYETVLVERVRHLVDDDVWQARYDEINAWEAGLAAKGVTVLKCMLHISKDEQRQRLLDRLADSTKLWKYNPGDVDERALWDDYQAAYQDALVRCSTDVSPWYVVPADRKWHRDWLLAHLLVETLRTMDPQYPGVEFDVEAERERVAAS
jgi:PPK2 family polyphosphate:nucleotide phosphotransferase